MVTWSQEWYRYGLIKTTKQEGRLTIMIIYVDMFVIGFFQYFDRV